MRLIDADALKAVIEEEEKGLETFEFQLAATACINHIEQAPTIDAVEVVRCRDCKWGKFLTHIPPWTHCCVRDPKEAPSKQAKDFCSYGERKDNER